MHNETMHENALSYMKTLLAIPSPTGYTRDATDYLLSELERLGFSPERTRKGCVYCELGGEGNGLLLSAHVDTLGLMVRSVKSNGRIRYTHVGGGHDATIETENCTIHTRDGRAYPGTVQSTKASQHVFRNMGDEPRNDETLEIVLDEEVHSAQDVAALGIETGCFVSLDPRTVVTPAGYVKSRYLDDKASAGMLLALAREVSEGRMNLKRRAAILFTVFEEVGHGASAGIPEDTEDLLVVDMGCVGEGLSCTEQQVSICAKDSSGPYDYAMTGELIDLCQKHQLDYAVDVYPFYGSDAGAALRSGRDIRYALIGAGVYASHGYERSHVKGVENTLRLIEKYVEKA